MKRLLFVVLAVCAVSLQAQPLKVVTVSAPAINTVFSTTGTVTVKDFTSPVFKTGFLQSRNYQAAPGSPAAGLWVYEYRIDLRNVVGVTSIPSISSLTLTFGPSVGTLDFNSDGKPDDVFVITKGGLGNVPVVSAVRTLGNNVTFNFSPSVAGGGAPGKGDSTFFFGIVSKSKLHTVNATLAATPGGTILPQAWAPKFFELAPPPPKPK